MATALSTTMFTSRKDAGKQLAGRLEHYADEKVIVYALPRGGVVVAYEVAKALRAPLDVLTARKVGHPDFPEYAVAAVSESGYVAKNEEAVRSVGEERFDELVESAGVEVRRRRNLYMKGIKSQDPKDKVAIIVDDGLATGLSARAAIRDLRERGPKKIVLAVPVAPDVALTTMPELVDDFVCLYPEPNLIAIGLYYQEFSQVSDEEVIKLLRKANKEFTSRSL